MKAFAIGLLALMIIATSAFPSLAGNSGGYGTDQFLQAPKMGVHIAPYAARRSCDTGMPDFTGPGDLNRREDDYADYDFIIVLFDYGTAITGAEYGLIWPGDWTSSITKICADLSIGDITDPGDGMSMTWDACTSAGVGGFPISWHWITPSSNGEIKITWNPDPPDTGYLRIADCAFSKKDVEYVYFAAIGMEPWDGAWVSTEPTTWGGIKAMFR